MNEKRWEKCECGVIERMLAGNACKSSRRKWLLSVLAVGLAFGSISSLIAKLVPNAFRRSQPATGQQPLACEAVHRQLQNFVDNRVCDAYVRGMISRHLFTCQPCQQAYRKLIDDEEFSCNRETSG